MENNESKKVGIKNGTYYYFDDIIQIENFGFDILLDEKSYENFLIYNISCAKPLHIRFYKVDGLIMMELDS